VWAFTPTLAFTAIPPIFEGDPDEAKRNPGKRPGRVFSSHRAAAKVS